MKVGTTASTTSSHRLPNCSRPMMLLLCHNDNDHNRSASQQDPRPKLKSCHNMPSPSSILGIIYQPPPYIPMPRPLSNLDPGCIFSPASVNGAHPACILATWPPPPPVIIASNMSVTRVTQYFRDPLTPAS